MEQKNPDKFDRAAAFLTPRIAELLHALPEEEKCRVREIRLRAGRPVTLTGAAETLFLFQSGRLSGIYASSAVRATAAELQDSFSRLCAYSVHSHRESIRSGFITVEGGHRAGICGTAVCEGGKLSGLRDIASINLRIAGEYPGVADELYRRLYAEGLCSLLIAGPPGSGKTTLLRDLARQLSGAERGRFYRCAVVDERGEIASVYRYEPQNDVGLNCDVLNAYPKGEAILSALRSLSPEIIICDELGGLDEIKAMEEGLHTGVHFAVSAHAAAAEDFARRPQLCTLLAAQAFDYVALLEGAAAPCRIKRIYRREELEDALSRSGSDGRRLFPTGAVLGGADTGPRQGA